MTKENTNTSKLTTYINKYSDIEDSTAKNFIFAGNMKVATEEDSTVIYHHEDHLTGANVDTDGSGSVLQLLDYFPYGNVQIDDKAGSYENDYKFTGKELDEDTNLYYYEARYYDAEIGRFVSLDPWFGDLRNPQSLNKYAYALNNPLRYNDPSGGNAAEVLAKTWTLAFGTAMADSPVPGPADLLAGAIAIGGTVYAAGLALKEFFSEEEATSEPSNTDSSVESAGGSDPDDDGGEDGDNQVGPKKGDTGGPGEGKKFPEKTKDQARNQSDNKCVFCGTETERKSGPNQSQIDHAVPKSRGGNNTLENAQNTCRTCNLQKGTKTTEEFTGSENFSAANTMTTDGNSHDDD